MTVTKLTEKPADEARLDGPYENVFLRMGGPRDRSSATSSSFTRLEQGQLESLYLADGFARKMIDVPAEEMLRAGWCVEGIDDSHDVDAALEGIGAAAALTEAIRWADLYGGSAIVMLLKDGGELDQPLREDSVKAIEQLRVYDRHQVVRHRVYEDASDSRFGKTEIYQISPTRGTAYLVHESRCLIMDGAPVPNRVREENDGWGESRLQQALSQLTRFGASQSWANALLERAQQAVHGIPELTNLLRTKDGEKMVKKRVDIVDMTRSVNNTVVIDAAESYDLKSTSLSGVADIIDRLGLSLSAVSGLPESLLFGRQQGGLNSTGAADLEQWYAKVRQAQETRLLPALDRLITLTLKVQGRYDLAYTVEFKPLSVPSAKQQAETNKIKADTYVALAGAQMLDPSEGRKMLAADGYAIDDEGDGPQIEGLGDDEDELDGGAPRAPSGQ